MNKTKGCLIANFATVPKHHAVILVSPAVVQGAPDITREIQQDIARRMRAEP
ncbi:TrbI F-type domain-containing protein [Klebsiella pneumoniae]|uniref:TrbI F-type domain-containing protein n=1 Tax=Klebsiella pneumoniae TaxID=573 RepID=UPI0021E61980|nr:TrbI F-type domain-containing protein [Klebsiella pneumoniae]